jgi:hypothetical protein
MTYVVGQQLRGGAARCRARTCQRRQHQVFNRMSRLMTTFGMSTAFGTSSGQGRRPTYGHPRFLEAPRARPGHSGKVCVSTVASRDIRFFGRLCRNDPRAFSLTSLPPTRPTAPLVAGPVRTARIYLLFAKPSRSPSETDTYVLVDGRGLGVSPGLSLAQAQNPSNNLLQGVRESLQSGTSMKGPSK